MRLRNLPGRRQPPRLTVPAWPRGPAKTPGWRLLEAAMAPWALGVQGFISGMALIEQAARVLKDEADAGLWGGGD